MSDDDLDFMPAAPDAEDAPDDGSPAESGESGDKAPGERAELPTWNRSRRKRKANVKAEKEDDAFQRGVRKASRQVIDAPKLAIGAIVITVLVIAGYVVLTNRKHTADATAARTLQIATDAIAHGQVVSPEEQEQYAEVMKQYRGPFYSTEDERVAAIDAALADASASGSKLVELNSRLPTATQAMQRGDFDAALTEYDAFLAGADDDHPLRFLALEGKGNALEAKGELDAALAVFQLIAPNTSDVYRPMAFYHRGRVLEGLGRIDEALAIYQEFFDEFKVETMATPLIRKRVEALDPEFAARLSQPAGVPLLPP